MSCLSLTEVIDVQAWATFGLLKFENFRNDPAAGSPTATLLRLLLPLLVKHGSTFAGAANRTYIC